MKNIILSVVLMPCLVFMAIAQDKPELSRSENIKNLIEAPFRKGDYKSENFWKDIPAVNINEEANVFRYPAEKKWNGPKDLSGYFKAAYDNDNIYFNINVSDDILVKRSAELPEGDEIEIYMAFPKAESSTLAWGKDMFQLRIIPFNDRGVFLGFKDPNPIPGSQSITQRTKDGYSLYASIPINSFNCKAESGKLIPFDLRIMDSDVQGKPVKVSMMWNNFPDKLKPWKTASGWGTLKFVGKFSKSYLDGERVLIEEAEKENPLKADDHTLFLADFDRNCDAVFSKGDSSPNLKGKAGKTKGVKGKFGEALKSINDYQSICSYECKNNMDMNNGTVELWFKTDRKPKECKFPVFWCIRSHSFGGKQTNAFSLQYDQRVEALTLSISDDKGKRHNLVMPFKLEPEKWSHLAATWRNLNSGKADAELSLYANGNECLDKIENVKIDFRPSENSRFFLGSSSTEVYEKASNPAYAEIDDLRISDIPRKFSPKNSGSVEYIPKRTKDGKLLETRYLLCSLPGTKNEIDEIIRIASEANYNVIAPSVNPGDYKSDLSMMKPEFAVLDFDPLAYMIEKAHEKGLEAHPYLGIGALNRVFWPCVMYDGKVAEDRLNPGNPKVRDYIVNEILELAENYDADGISLDFIRYSFFNYSREEAKLMKEKYGIDIFSFGKNPAASLDPARLKWFKWRENNIHDIVKRVWTETRKVDPELIMSAYVWNSTPPRIAQAWEVWSKNGWLDRLLIMNYSKLAGEVSAIHRESQKRSGSPDMVVPILATYSGYIRDAGGITKMTTEELAKQIKAIRKYNPPGVGHFSLNWGKKEDIVNLNKNAFSEKSIPSFRAGERNKIKRKKQKREFDISSIAYNDGIMKEEDSSSVIELPEEKIIGGICVKGNEKCKVEFLDKNGNLNLLAEGSPGEFGLASLVTFPPIKAKKIKVKPEGKLIAATRFFGTDQNSVVIDKKDWMTISPEANADTDKLKGIPLIKVSKSGQAFFEAENGKMSGSAVEIKKCGNRKFADMPGKILDKSRPAESDGSLNFIIDIEKEGDYELWANVNGPNPTSDSLFVQIGNKRREWHITTHGRFEWKCFCYGFRDSKKYIMFHLKPGKYLLKISWREADAKIDKLCIKRHN